MAPQFPLYRVMFVIVALAIAATIGASAQVFIENRGQWNPQAKYLLRGGGFDMWVTDHGLVYDLSRPDPDTHADAARISMQVIEPASAGRVQHAAVSMSFLGADPAAGAHGVEQAPGCHNYFIGNDPSHWATNVPLYKRARIEKLYDGIDAVFYLDSARPRYDLVIAAGADVSRVRMQFQGAGKLRVDSAGSLVIETPLGEIRQRELFAYQISDGERHPVQCAFVVGGDSAVGFEVGRYDRRRELVIDPVVVSYATYFGGSGEDDGYGITADNHGNAYFVGRTGSPNFPTIYPTQPVFAGGFLDAFVTKLNSAGDYVYSTYLGGSNLDDGKGIAVDSANNVYFTGVTNSTNFPTMNAVQTAFAGFTDAFVAKLDGYGALVMGTYLGGRGQDNGYGIAVDGGGNIYVAGITASDNFPLSKAFQTTYGQGAYDAFLTKLTPQNTLAYSTYLGGGDDDEASGIAVDNGGNAYVVGKTGSTGFPLLNPAQPLYGGGVYDLFITKFTAAGTPAYSTYLGGASYEMGTGIAIDKAGNAYVAGFTQSPNFPVLNATQGSLGGSEDMCAAKLSANGALQYSTYFGGSEQDQGAGVAVDGRGNAYITGFTRSTNFPTQNALQSSFAGGNSDAVMVILSTTGARTYSTYYGGGGEDAGNGIAMDSAGIVYITGISESKDFPTDHAVQKEYGGGTYDAFVLRLFVGSDAIAAVDAGGATGISGSNMPRLGAVTPNPATNDIQVRYTLPNAGAVTLDVYASDGRLVATPVNGENRDMGDNVETISVAKLAAGAYTLRLVAASGSRVSRFVIVR